MGKVSEAPRCQKCGKIKDYCMDRGCYRCKSCSAVPRVESRQDPLFVTASRPQVELPLEELDQALKLAAKQERRVTVIDCKGCGAQVETPVGEDISECLFCGRTSQLEETEAQTHEHQVVVPFRINKEDAVSRMKEHLGKLWFRPGLASDVSADTVRKVYLPFWCYDVSVHTDWSGSTSVWEEPGCLGKLFGMEGKYRSVPVSGMHQATYDDWLVCASKGLDSKLLRKLEPFDTEGAELRRLDDDLDGVALEVGSTSPFLGWTRAQLEIRAEEHDACRRKGQIDAARIGGSGVNVSGLVTFDSPKAKGALLPLYMFSKRTVYGSCKVVVNGETGECASKVPYSLPKAVPVVLLVILALILGTIVTGGLGPLFLAGFILYDRWRGDPSVEKRAKSFPSS